MFQFNFIGPHFHAIKYWNTTAPDKVIKNKWFPLDFMFGYFHSYLTLNLSSIHPSSSAGCQIQNQNIARFTSVRIVIFEFEVNKIFVKNGESGIQGIVPVPRQEVPFFGEFISGSEFTNFQLYLRCNSNASVLSMPHIGRCAHKIESLSFVQSLFNFNFQSSLPIRT